MPRFSLYDVIAVPFPYFDRPVRQRRPALVVSGPDLEATHGLLWVAMITAAENGRWDGDVPIADHGEAGLPIPSVVRPAKLATVEAAEATRRGVISREERRAVAAELSRWQRKG
jgi:mRNA interferase MazF